MIHQTSETDALLFFYDFCRLLKDIPLNTETKDLLFQLTGLLCKIIDL